MLYLEDIYYVGHLWQEYWIAAISFKIDGAPRWTHVHPGGAWLNVASFFDAQDSFARSHL